MISKMTSPGVLRLKKRVRSPTRLNVPFDLPDAIFVEPLYDPVYRQQEKHSHHILENPSPLMHVHCKERCFVFSQDDVAVRGQVMSVTFQNLEVDEFYHVQRKKMQ